MEKMRLQKFLAQAGAGSRRSSEQLILSGRVKVNGSVCDVLGTSVTPGQDRVQLDGREVLLPEQKFYYMLNKPEGYMVSRSDPHQPQTIYTLLPPEFEILHPVGRLDQNSCGLLLLTNDGDLTDKLLHPRFKMEKVYRVQVKGRVTELTLKYLSEGVELSDGKTLPARVVRLRQRSDHPWLEFTLKEGRNRQIRRMCRAVGLDVIYLERVAFGPLHLSKMPVGAWRELTEEEIRSLLKKTEKISLKPTVGSESPARVRENLAPRHPEVRIKTPKPPPAGKPGALPKEPPTSRRTGFSKPSSFSPRHSGTGRGSHSTRKPGPRR
ncbi:hypothetical protein COW36_05245 [bacterium (Candidatus Blackallbacteria) CG17_big_fil_post_rev_8_21_14_2_50_48_46]|uniref:Pseudouridine synthase n=1 Tax=bacterium (Candidatus Blackallbacteria) CG17_big_fil_post_rev_8_21_14_2_50_48_46 TaxID=2014261 RepID=A0A2M7G9B8_9BACT|nr:MAG: hypothetical protein COW64_03700 [bacterium (Candidatus Blackallbacteria) CG18_big_fil_WC_8_21_14_2_50_49_26]PIW18702.1 MAG: hypothetical protein COW36_05245 [bacterium (Candidatus Blackallbacteria) CG17_big_fil_post_rev_8_21_14_2_50_48_46]PIW46312.1 MAG: hypothetical protein COW20_15435 [bacterium (Candidatus Blackallbacteria) CG13_big_fil_rev_8_21_14_2_50_49_14]